MLSAIMVLSLCAAVGTAHDHGASCRHDEFVDKVVDAHVESMRLHKIARSRGETHEMLPAGKVPLSKIGKPSTEHAPTHVHDVISAGAKGLHVFNMYGNTPSVRSTS